MRPLFSLAELLPHRQPMVLLDEVVEIEVEARSITTSFIAKPKWTGNWVAIEYMAQTAAALAGYFDKLEHADMPARPGFLLGTRKLEIMVEKFEVGARYLVKAVNEFADNEAASFACEILDANGKVVAKANLNAYRPVDFKNFITQRAENMV